jgi:parvulin-like peptidyl-prolyl isomerase
MLGFTVAACVGIAGGCMQNKQALAGDPGLLDAIAQAGMGTPPVSRGQQPDSASRTQTPLADAPPGGGPNVVRTSGWDRKPLDMQPERSGEVSQLPPSARIRVVVNGEAILDEEIRAACYHALRAAEQLAPEVRARKVKEIFDNTCNQLVEREVVLQEARQRLSSTKQGSKFLDKLKEAARKDWEKTAIKSIREQTKLETEEQIRALFAAQGLSLDLMERKFERDFMMMEYLRNRVFTLIEKIGHKEVAEYYDTHPEEFELEDAVEWQDIFVSAAKHPSREDARRFAQSLADRGRAGEDFVKLSAQNDDGDSHARPNSAGEGRKRGEISPQQVEDDLFKLKEGEVGQVVELPGGFHIVRVAKRIYKGQQPFDAKVQTQIKNFLRSEMAQREIKRIVADLKRRAIIEYSSVTN